MTWTLALVLGWAGACKSKDDTNIIVEVWSDLSIPAQLNAIRIDVSGSTASTPQSFPLAGPNELPVHLAIVPRAAKDAPATVKAVGLLGPKEIVWQSAQVAFVPGESKLLKLFLGASCTNAGCGPTQSCTAGACTPVPTFANLPEYQPKASPTPPDAGVRPAVDGGKDAANAEAAQTGAGEDASTDHAPEVANADGRSTLPDAPTGTGGDAGEGGGGATGTDGAAGSSGTGGAGGLLGGSGGSASGTGGVGGMTGGSGGAAGRSGTGGSGGTGGRGGNSITDPVPQDAGSPDVADAPIGGAAGGAGGSTGGAGGTGGAQGTGGTGGSSTPVVDCGPPSRPTDGSVSAPSTTEGSTATYSCTPGYALTGLAMRTCENNGSWSGAAPTCTLVDCGVLPPFANGVVSAPVTTYGSIAAYSCTTVGFILSGDANRTCEADATWSGTAPVCGLADCGTPPPLANGTISAPVTTYNSHATYSCTATGFVLSGSADRTCQANAEWSGDAPTCRLVDCGAPPALANGTVSAPVTTYNASATYSCSVGFNLSGNASLTCEANGQWNGPAPNCVPAYGNTCSAPATCSSSAECCDGSIESCDGTRLPTGDGSNTGEFTVSLDGLTVTDTITGLVWQRDGTGTRSGCTTEGSNLTCTWAEAKRYCQNLVLGGLTGWRLPGRTELHTMMDFTRTGPAIDLTAFPATGTDWYWTSTPFAQNPVGAWIVDLYSGYSTYPSVAETYRVRCVR